MASDSLWRSRLRWRTRGALLWPLFCLLTVADAVLLGFLPIAGDAGTDLVPALLLAGFFNLLVVAVIAPLAAGLLRRRRPDLPRIVAQDYAGRAGLVLVSAALVAGGLAHHGALEEATGDAAAGQHAALVVIERRAPPEFRDHLERASTLRIDDDLYRTCVPGPDPKRWFCVYARTDTSPPGVTIDGNRESNLSLNRPGAF